MQNSALNLSIRLFITQLVNGLAIHFFSLLLSKCDAITCKKCAIISYRRQLSVDNLHIQRSIHTRFSYICVRQYVCVICAHIFNVINQFTNMLQKNKLHHHKQIAADVAVSMSIQIRYRILQFEFEWHRLRLFLVVRRTNFHISSIIITQWNHDKSYHLSPKISLIKCNSYRLIFDASRHVQLSPMLLIPSSRIPFIIVPNIHQFFLFNFILLRILFLTTIKNYLRE